MKLVEDYFQLLNENSAFLLKTFANLMIQLGITYYIAFKIKAISLSWIMYIFLVIVQFAIVFLLHMTHNILVQVGMFSVFSVCVGVLLNGVYSNTNMKWVHDVIKIIGIVFFTMFLLGGLLLAGGIAFGIWTIIFMIALLIIYLVLSVGNLFVNSNSLSNWLYIFGTAIFTAFIVIDTNRILQDSYQNKKTPINASMRYYLDILNLFEILMSRKTGTKRALKTVPK